MACQLRATGLDAETRNDKGLHVTVWLERDLKELNALFHWLAQGQLPRLGANDDVVANLQVGRWTSRGFAGVLPWDSDAVVCRNLELGLGCAEGDEVVLCARMKLHRNHPCDSGGARRHDGSAHGEVLHREEVPVGALEGRIRQVAPGAALHGADGLSSQAFVLTCFRNRDRTDSREINAQGHEGMPMHLLGGCEEVVKCGRAQYAPIALAVFVAVSCMPNGGTIMQDFINLTPHCFERIQARALFHPNAKVIVAMGDLQDAWHSERHGINSCPSNRRFLTVHEHLIRTEPISLPRGPLDLLFKFGNLRHDFKIGYFS
mmetsp:Transcript_126371/g.328093  ORF Transcript_126371/g.328093 Transcript_126371/m.328093 type:complete len:318 (+) Transcript_126371:1426-2379(+)